jgi:predicted AAA+ superfamily ATPase
MEIIREHYINEIILVKNKHVIKVITGVRRCGKSTILEQYKIRLQEKFKIPSRCILQYDFNDPKFAKMTYMELYDDVLAKANKANINYLFLDEIQEIKQFEKAVIGFFENKMYRFDIYITGSNSKMFSSSLATLFTGRNYEIKVYPFSFREYLLFIDTRKDMQRMSYREIFNKYLTYGGMPIIFNVFDNKSLIKNYIDIFLKDTLNKDVSRRHTIRTLPTFNKFAKYVFEQNGNIFSTHAISNYLRSNNNTHTNHKTIDRYLM